MKRALAILLALLILGGLGTLARDVYRPFRGYTQPQMLEVEPGMRADRVAALLAGHGVLRYRLPFLILYGWGRLRHRSIKAGEYLFDQPLSPAGVYAKLQQGKVYFRLVVVPEGSDCFDIARIVQEQLGVPANEFLRVTRETAMIRDLDPFAPSLEGYLFPDSYRFPAKTSAAAVAQTMLARFRRVLGARFGSELKPGSAQLHTVITLASLVEKETPEASERALVAGVFQRRLQRGMLLQCDPTVIYAARLQGSGAAATRITEADLNSASPYNTYRHPGLPPGPICSPGEASIRAALHPAAGDALYFVSNLRGGHVFAPTLEEHHRNVARYRRSLRQEQEDAPAGEGGRPASGNPLGKTPTRAHHQEGDHS